MKKIAQYQGRLLNHVETLYRPGERALAIELAEALGCTVLDTGFKGDGADTFLGAHPDPEDHDRANNAFFLSEMRPEQVALEAALRQVCDADASLADQLEQYRNTARTKPFGVPHFGIRFRAASDVAAAGERLAALQEKLGDRLHFRIFHPGQADAAGGELMQAFVYQDVIVSGSFLIGQLIELQTIP
jgi:hypothetical protein